MQNGLIDSWKKDTNLILSDTLNELHLRAFNFRKKKMGKKSKNRFLSRIFESISSKPFITLCVNYAIDFCTCMSKTISFPWNYRNWKHRLRRKSSIFLSIETGADKVRQITDEKRIRWIRLNALRRNLCTIIPFASRLHQKEKLLFLVCPSSTFTTTARACVPPFIWQIINNSLKIALRRSAVGAIYLIFHDVVIGFKMFVVILSR